MLHILRKKKAVIMTCITSEWLLKNISAEILNYVFFTVFVFLTLPF